MKNRDNAFLGGPTKDDDCLLVAGRRVLRGAISLALALSLAPSHALDVLADELRSVESREGVEVPNASPETIDEERPPEARVVRLDGEGSLVRGQARYSVTVSGMGVDLARTSVFGNSLHDILEALGDGEIPSWQAGERLTFSDLTTDRQEDGGLCCTLTVTLDNTSYDGCPAVVFDEQGTEVRAEDISIVADSEAPLVTEASLHGACLPGAHDDPTEQARHDGICFLSSGEGDAHVTLKVTDLSGIESITMHDPSGEYELTGDSYRCGPGEVLEVALPPLVEGAPFRDDVVVTLADAAGNERTWSLKEQGTVESGLLPEEVENVDLTCGGIPLGHPHMLLEDHHAPEVTVSGVVGGEQLDRLDAQVVVNVEERFLDYLRRYDPRRVVATLFWSATKGGHKEASEVLTVEDLDANGVGALPLGKDGHYRIEAGLIDLAGNASDKVAVDGVTVDTTPPVFTVSFDSEEEAGTQGEVAWYDQPRVATVRVEEENFDASLMRVVATHDGWVSSEPELGEWQHEGTVHTLKVSFAEGNGYRLVVSGSDEAGNAARLGAADGEDEYRSETFGIDLSAPVMTSDYDEVREGEATEHEGRAYFASEFDVTITVRDRNLDADSLVAMVDGTPVSANRWSVSKAADGTTVYAQVVHYAEGMHQTPEVIVCDHAGNEAHLNALDFVVDCTAPEVVSVTTSRVPVSTGQESAESAPTLFFNHDTALTFELHDHFGLGTVRLVDPKGVHGVSPAESGVARGATDATLSVDLVEGMVGDEPLALGDDAFLEVIDIAGNRRVWTLDRRGDVMDAIGSSPSNVSLNDGGLHPRALIKDATPPWVELTGVEAGRFYDSDQTVHVRVDDATFAQLQRFDGSRPVLRITSWTGDSRRVASSLSIPAALFTGAGSVFTFDHVFDADGHYSLEAGFADYADNQSNVVSIGEFTIDKTPPAISLSWDSEEAKEGRFFDAARTAVISVEEHNFDPSLMDISTTGVVGGWSSSGDVHTCEVLFGEGGPHTLSVNGRDLAGNAAQGVSAREFVVDLTPPTIDFGGVAQRIVGGEVTSTVLNQGGAYNGIVSPTVSFADDKELDEESLSLTVVGNKLGEVGESYPHVMSSGEAAVEVSYDDFGRGDAGAPYDIDADDVYTINASARDLAGNETTRSITFSVNRYGSNFLVEAKEDGRDVDLTDGPILDGAPTIIVREINVSGFEPQATRFVTKEFASKVSEIGRDDVGPLGGYRLEEVDRSSSNHGWSECVYTIRSSNFGEGSDSDDGDGGQGTYRVNVASDDRAGNANTMTDYWSSDESRSQAVAKTGTTSFTLDELGPTIDGVDMPEGIVVGSSFEASFHVSDAITKGNDVEVFVGDERVPVLFEGHRLAVGEQAGEGTFTFKIPARSFAARKVTIKVSDYARRMASFDASGLHVTTLVPEAAIALALLVLVGVILCKALGIPHVVMPFGM